MTVSRAGHIGDVKSNQALDMAGSSRETHMSITTLELRCLGRNSAVPQTAYLQPLEIEKV
jgi:hypothetical protein